MTGVLFARSSLHFNVHRFCGQFVIVWREAAWTTEWQLLKMWIVFTNSLFPRTHLFTHWSAWIAFVMDGCAFWSIKKLKTILCHKKSLCSAEERKLYTPGMTREWINGMIFYFIFWGFVKSVTFHRKVIYLVFWIWKAESTQ